MTVQEAAQRLGLSEQAVRQMAASGRIDALKRGNAWWLDARAVERQRRQRPGRGRPLSAPMAWSVLVLASGQPGSDLLARHDRHGVRARRWLETHALAEYAPRLRARARSEAFGAHPSELDRMRARDDTMRTGISAAERVGLHGGRPAAELYAPASHREAIVYEHALDPGDGEVHLRWVDDRLWQVIASEVAPRAAVLIDLLEHDEPRARRQAAKELAR